MSVRFLITVSVALTSFATVGWAEPSTDETLANAALSTLHDLAIASDRLARAGKDGDIIGCKEASDALQQVAHVAFENLHRMSPEPKDALEQVSALLRLRSVTTADCPDQMVVDLLPMTAGQAIFGLRTDWAIGSGDWYTTDATGTVEAKNPLGYAQSLSDQNYSWVDVRPKGMFFIGVSDWKAEMLSHEVGDPAIENSGTSLKAVEVGYRKDSGDSNTEVYFYRTREEAQAAARAAKQLADADAEAIESTKAWQQKLLSLTYLAANNDPGFKLTYALCLTTADSKGEKTCHENGSFDFSNGPGEPYEWFRDVQECDAAELKVINQPPIKGGPDDSLTTNCMPAPKSKGRVVKGYKMVIGLVAPGDSDSERGYSDLREEKTQKVKIFRTFDSCYAAMDVVYPKALRDLGADAEGTLLKDKSKYISLTANCVRVY